MAALLQFNSVMIDKTENLSFSIDAGETRVLQVVSHEAKAEFIDLALGEMTPANGEILLHGQLLDASRPGNIGLIPANGGLISNLKAWENITLPLWYHHRRQARSTEEVLIRWLRELEIDSKDWEGFMSSPTARLTPDEHKMAGLLRALVQAPQLLLVDAGLFDEVASATVKIWIGALEKFVSEAEGRALLVVASAATSLPWKIIGA